MEEKKLLESLKAILKGDAKKKFKQTVELNINFTGVNVEGPQKINANVKLPKGRGKDVEIGFFADGDMNVRAKKISKYVLGKDEIEEYAKDRQKMKKFANECYTFVAQPDLMPVIGKSWGVVLGPRNKMPQPIPGNVDLEPIVKRLKDSVKVRTKKTPSLHVPVGTEEMSAEDLAENINAVVNEVMKVVTEENIRNMYVKTTMGKAVRIW
ncbi:MAG TPA: 50S ribosomal protein L1 [Candidatus Altiarchaeales archaeon]|nr:50S ribosomal protein L1 [Candidatus Altiarchaeales archaeon]